MRHWFHRGQILAGIATRRHALCGPLYATFKVTNVCNLSCHFCEYHAPDPRQSNDPATKRRTAHLDPEAAVAMMQDLYSLGTREISLQGDGEPLLYPHLLDLIDAGKQLGFNVSLITNGTLITRRVAREFVKLGLDGIRISIMAGSPESFAALRGPSDRKKWYAVRAGVKALIRERVELGSRIPKVRLHHALTRRNCFEIPQMLDHAIELRVDSVTFAPLVISKKGIERIALNQKEHDETIETLSWARERTRALGLSNNIDETLMRYHGGEDVYKRMRCYIAWLSTCVRSTGEVFPCVMSRRVAGNIYSQRFRDIWRNGVYQDFRFRASRMGGAADPMLQARCSFCCHYPLLVKTKPFRRPGWLVKRLTGRCQR